LLDDKLRNRIYCISLYQIRLPECKTKLTPLGMFGGALVSLEQRLGRTASKGYVRISTGMNEFLGK
jgi:hypothetical protein